MIEKISKELSRRFFLNPYLFIFGIVFFLYFIYDYYVKSTSGLHLIPVSVLALLAGVIFESKRVTNNWFIVIVIGVIAFVFCYTFTNFLTTLVNEPQSAYNSPLNISIRRWPEIFILFYFIFSLFFYKDRIIPKLTEGITLLQSLAVIYWVADYGLITSQNPFMQVLLVIGLLFSLFSIFHAFTKTRLSNTHKLILSIWSSIIMMLFALDNLNAISKMEEIENATNLINAIYIALQYFLLGISSIYIVQNFLMLYRFLPRRKKFFNSRYFDKLQELKYDHINRYSDQQVSWLEALICILLIGTVFFLNYYYQVVPRQFIIWMAFVTFPIVISLLNFIMKKPYQIFTFLFIMLFSFSGFSQSKADTNQAYIFFLHNKFVQENDLNVAHPEYGKAEYNEILATFRKDNFIVYSEKRKKNTNSADYAEKVVKQIKKLIKSGVKPNKITVIGTSQGGYIAQYVSTYLANPEVNFVFIGCFRDVDIAEIPDINFCGNILTIYEKSDIYGVSAVKRKETSKLKVNHFKEIELNTGLKHGFLYKALDEWIVPCKKWANGDYEFK